MPNTQSSAILLVSRDYCWQ